MGRLLPISVTSPRNFQRTSVRAMEVGSGRGWRWFPSGIEAFCEDLVAQESVGAEPEGSLSGTRRAGCCPGHPCGHVLAGRVRVGANQNWHSYERVEAKLANLDISSVSSIYQLERSGEHEVTTGPGSISADSVVLGTSHSGKLGR